MVTDLWESSIDIMPLSLSHRLGDLSLDVARFDQLHPILSGNKFYKLFYWIQSYKQRNYRAIESYGGVHSNHLHALSYLCHQLQIPLVAKVRAWEGQMTPTLQDMQQWNTQLEGISRSDYRNMRHNHSPKPHILVIPEGGDGHEGASGAAMMYTRVQADTYQNILIPMGSGTSYVGISSQLVPGQNLIGLLLFKTQIQQYLESLATTADNAEVLYAPRFGHFGKLTPEILQIREYMLSEYELPLDLIYGARAFGEILQNDELYRRLKGKRNLYMHTGGLQGNRESIN